MNTRLSTPSTISSVVSASSAIHSSELSRNSIAPTDRSGRQQPRPDDQTPAHRHIDQQHEYRRRTHVLGASGQFVVLRTRSEEHTSELQSLMRTSYAVFCLKKTRIFSTYN